MSIRQVFGDLETYWDQTHSLSKMSPILYCVHPKTQIISASFKEGVNGKPFTVFGEDETYRACADLKLGSAMFIGHNFSAFDSMIYAWRLGVRPAMWGCTLAMARPIHAKDVGLGLGKLVAHYGLGHKNAAVLHETKGKCLEDFTAQQRADMAKYNADDVDQCAGLFDMLLPHFTPEELWHIDCNIRMLVRPMFVVDRQVLEAGAAMERDIKLKAINTLARMMREQYVDMELDWDDREAVEEFVRSEMASQPKFAALLTKRGVDVPTKPSPTDPSKFVPALAKTDEAFTALQDHEDELVAAAARARLAVKSTLTETRIQAFLEVSEAVGGRLPVTLNYAGADTTGRDSGWAYNPQNMPRINPGKTKPSDALRRSLTAPPNYVIGVADQSGIELRMNHWFWGVPSTAELYRKDPKADLYKDFASYYYEKTPDEVTKDERQFAKVCQLGLGFGAGPTTFQRVARLMGGIKLAQEQSEAAVAGWRARYKEIAEGWRECNAALEAIASGSRIGLGPDDLVTTEPEGLRLPSGRMIRYPNLRFVDEGEKWPDGRSKRSWVYADGRHKTFMHGAKVTENIIQALARDSVFECAVRFFKSSKLRPAMRVHDELIYMFPESEAEALLAELQSIMRSPPSWGPSMVLWSEGDVARCYGDAK